jgi:hypothetical protein
MYIYTQKPFYFCIMSSRPADSDRPETWPVMMTIDARTAEIAATLMDIASMAKTETRNGDDTSVPLFPGASSEKKAGSSIAHNNPVVWEQRQPQTAPVTTSFGGPPLLPGSNNSSSSRPSQVGGLPPADRLQEPVAPMQSSWSSAGVGSDSSVMPAALAAIRDALQRERGNQPLLLPADVPEARMRIQLAVPARTGHDGSVAVSEPMWSDNDTVRLQQELGMSCVIQVQVGGMMVPCATSDTVPTTAATSSSSSSSSSSAKIKCIVVAHVSVQTNASAAASAAPSRALASQSTPLLPGTCSGHKQVSPEVSTSRVASSPPPPNLKPSPTSVLSSSRVTRASQVQDPSLKQAALQRAHTAATAPPPPLVSHGFYQLASTTPSLWPTAEHGGAATQDSMPKRQSNSMEMLASISAAMMAQHQQEQAAAVATTVTAAVQGKVDEDKPGVITNGGSMEIRYTFKKLPPGQTSKNNKRLFVRHSYRDYSHEALPILQEQERQRLQVASSASCGDESKGRAVAAAGRTPNAAFPLKLHEILTQIERDGHENIIGTYWVHCVSERQEA